MTISEDKELIIGLPNGVVLRLNKAYVEMKAQWDEAVARAAKYRIK